MTPGFLITIEGADGAGKTRQAMLLSERLAELGHDAFLTREPSDRPIGKLIREALAGRSRIAASAMSLLFAADRADHVALVIDPARERGAVVVCDRYTLSNVVYRAAEAEGAFLRCTFCGVEDEPPRVLCPRCQTRAMSFSPSAIAIAARVLELDRGVPVPDLTIVLRVWPETASARRQARGGDPELFENTAYEARCCAAYQRIDEIVPQVGGVVQIDGEGNEEAVAARIWATTLDRLVKPPRGHEVRA